MKRALILHGWAASPEKHWFLDEKKELEKMGYEVSIPNMPNPINPKKDAWVKVIEDFNPDIESVLIGHSIGGTTILKYLENSNQKVEAAVLVAVPVGYQEIPKSYNLIDYLNKLRHFLQVNFLFSMGDYDYGFRWGKIRRMANKFVIINQKNDQSVHLSQGKILSQHLGGKYIIIPGWDHVSRLDLSLINHNI